MAESSRRGGRGAARGGSKRAASTQLSDAERKRVRREKDQARKERAKQKQQEEEEERRLNPIPNLCDFCATHPAGIFAHQQRKCDWVKYSDTRVECRNCADFRSQNPGLLHECRVGQHHMDHRRYGVNDPAVPAVAACKPCSDKHKGDTCNVDVHLGYQCTNCRKGRCRAGGVQLKPRPDSIGEPVWFRHACDRCQADDSGGKCSWLDDRTAWSSACGRCLAGGHLCLWSNTLIAVPSVPAPESWAIPNGRHSDAGTLELQRNGTTWRKWCKACAVSKTLYSCRITESQPFSSCVRCNQLGIDCVDAESGRVFPLASLSRVGFGRWTPFQGCARCEETGRPCDRQRPCDSCTTNADRDRCDKWIKTKNDRLHNCVAQFDASPPALYYLAHGYGPRGVRSVKDGTKLYDWIGPLVPKYSTLNAQDRAKNMAKEIADAHNDFRPDHPPPQGGSQGSLQGSIPSILHAGSLEQLMRQTSHPPIQNPAYQEKFQAMSHPDWPPTREGFGAPLGRPIATPAPEAPEPDPTVADPPAEKPPVMDSPAPVIPVVLKQDLPMRPSPSPPANNPAEFAGIQAQAQAQIPPFQLQPAQAQDGNTAQPGGDDMPAGFEDLINFNMFGGDNFEINPALEVIGNDIENNAEGVPVQSNPMDPISIPQGPGEGSNHGQVPPELAGVSPNPPNPMKNISFNAFLCLGDNPYVKYKTKPSRWSVKNNVEGLEMSHWRQGEKAQCWNIKGPRLFGMAHATPVLDTPARDILEDIPLIRRQDTLQPFTEVLVSCFEPKQGGGTGICYKPAADEVGCQALIHRLFFPFNYLVCKDCVTESVQITVDESLKPLRANEIVKTRAYACDSCALLLADDKQHMKTLGKTGVKQIWGATGPKPPSPDEAVQEEGTSIAYQGATMPITGCACATKLLDRPLCRFHRLHYAELSMRHAAMMQEWRLCRFSKPVCPACLGDSKLRKVGISADYEGFKDTGGRATAWACLVCNDWVVNQLNDGNAPQLVDGSWDGVHQAKDIIVGKTTDIDMEGA
ncbi:hypothetical protein EDB81DRAFT_330224 [Dactylonectria macrodidyma]|uniref:Uncharacterized protein n=1 Tax=Dactylonectria macrodidyma TaxID=307937 RepID=A0A9P9FDI7_9HYPO|nr:hypothetical protein EDB81DRAFT_330224 [Dactylonectria macrodidyma]